MDRFIQNSSIREIRKNLPHVAIYKVKSRDKKFALEFEKIEK